MSSVRNVRLATVVRCRLELLLVSIGIIQAAKPNDLFQVIEEGEHKGDIIGVR